MLTMCSLREVRTLRLAAALVLICAAYIVFIAQPATADHCGGGTNPGELNWDCHGQDDQEQEDDGQDQSDTGGEPSCDLSLVEGLGRADASQWCEGENACFANIPSAIYPDPEDWPEDPPTEDAVYIFKECRDPDGEVIYADWIWHVPDQPPPEELAWDAYGQLRTPAFTLAFNPDHRTYVSLETWWWVDGPGDGEIIGTSDLGIRAVGEPSHIEANPGDGSPTFTCPWTTTESDACTYVYNRASVTGSATAPDGSPAYPAEARLHYTVRFEQNGAPLDLEGLPDSLESPWMETPVPVAEIQATVID